MARQYIPSGHIITGTTVSPSFQFETHKKVETLKYQGRTKTVIHATNHPAIELDLDWLPAAAESYCLSPDPKDYVLVSLPIVTSPIPNRNLQSFSLGELSYFDPVYGCLVYQTFNKKPCHIDHINTDPTKAKGIIVDSSMQHIPRYDVWKINIITLWDRTKDARLIQEIIDKKRTGYSMGASVAAFICTICGKIDNMDDKSCEHMKNKGSLWGSKNLLASQSCSGSCFFENSSVIEPADTSAFSLDTYV